MMPEANASIRYLMKEMDPAEETVFCREMANNQDLQIEVESLRSTHQRLSSAPRFVPPSHIRSAIRQRAAEAAARRRMARMQRRVIQAAAVLVVSLSPTLFFLYDPTPDGDARPLAGDRSDARAASPWVDRDARLTLSGWQPSTTANATLPFAGASMVTANPGAPTSPGASLAPAPATGMATTASEAVDSLYMQSFRKLRKLSGAVEPGRASADLQLTGSRRN